MSNGKQLVTIEYSIVPNGRELGGGYLPVYRTDGGKLRGDTWASRGYDIADAWYASYLEACDEARRYCGDYEVTIRPV